MKTRNASAQWKGNLKKGTGTINLPFINKDMAFSFASRFEDGEGTNPEELIAAAHSGCFSMAFSGLLADKGYDPESIKTIAKVSLEKKDGGWAIIKSELITEAKVSKIDEDEFQKLAQQAKANCPVSQALSSSLDISLSAKLLG